MSPGERAFSVLPVEQRDAEQRIIWAKFVRCIDDHSDVFDVLIPAHLATEENVWGIINAWLHTSCIPTGAHCTYPKEHGELEFGKSTKILSNGTIDRCPDWADNCLPDEDCE